MAVRCVRDGFAAVELVVATALAGLLLVGFAALQAAALRQATELARAAAVADLDRTISLLLPAELRYIDPADDVAALAGDSLRLRAFRGAAVVCAGSGSSLVIDYQGARLPEPAKDSALAVSDAAEVALPVLEVAAHAADEPCGAPATRTLRLRLGVPLPPGTMLLVFETGSYHLADGALRYRRGAGGRQPITLEWLESGGTGFASSPTAGATNAATAVNVTGEASGTHPPGPVRIRARWRVDATGTGAGGPTGDRRLTLRPLNGGPCGSDCAGSPPP